MMPLLPVMKETKINNTGQLMVIPFLEVFGASGDRLNTFVCVLLGISPASVWTLPTFQNPLSVPSSRAGCKYEVWIMCGVWLFIYLCCSTDTWMTRSLFGHMGKKVCQLSGTPQWTTRKHTIYHGNRRKWPPAFLRHRHIREERWLTRTQSLP